LDYDKSLDGGDAELADIQVKPKKKKASKKPKTSKKKKKKKVFFTETKRSSVLKTI
jgi:hypothetical protein